MKILANKVIRNIFSCIIILLVGIISHVNDFNFMNYDFIVNKNIFIIISLLLVLKLSINKCKLSNISLDNQYYYNLHILLIVIWIFLFFLYRIFSLSFITLLFNFIILMILNKEFYKYNKKILFNIIYSIWFMYLIIINLLILL